MSVDIPPPVKGDPAGMRALAAELRGTASRVGDVRSGVDGSVKSLIFDGPAGDAFRDGMQTLCGQVASVAAELQDMSGRLERAAAEVEAAQRARQAAIEAAAREAASARRHQATVEA
jgi:soluble cytochrome b562